MNTRFLMAGDLVECEVKGVTFTATIEAFGLPGQLKVKPTESWVTWRWVRSRQVTKKLEGQQQIAAVGAGRGEELRKERLLKPLAVETSADPGDDQTKRSGRNVYV